MNQFTLVTDFGDQTLRCGIEFSPYSPGVHTMPNGDPGYPDDPEEFYIEKVELKLADNRWLDISDLLADNIPSHMDDSDTPLYQHLYEEFCRSQEPSEEESARGYSYDE